jgi:N-acetylmuramoyl-L-alanine amidase
VTAANCHEGARDMIELRHAGLAICAVLSIALVLGGRGAAQAETAAPAQAPAPAAAPVQAPAQAPSPAPTAAAAAPAAAKPDACPRDKFRVVVDVGHTLDVPGAMSARGVTEYAFNLQLGQDADKALIDAGFGRTVLLITKTAPWLGLIERAQRANAMHADLFIALHHDSVPDNLMHPWQYNGQDQGYNDDYPGYAIFISNDNADRAGSLKFGSLLGKELQARGLQYTPHYTLALMGHHRRELVDAKAGVYRFNELLVLRETHMPAVLLEAGSIVNRQEELQLATPERRALTSAAIVAAVDEFCGSRAHPAAAKR